MYIRVDPFDFLSKFGFHIDFNLIRSFMQIPPKLRPVCISAKYYLRVMEFLLRVMKVSLHIESLSTGRQLVDWCLDTKITSHMTDKHMLDRKTVVTTCEFRNFRPEIYPP